MSNTITINKKVTTVETVPIEIELPYFSREKSEINPFYYCVVSPTELVRCCVSTDKKFTAMGVREQVSEAFEIDKVEITFEEFEKVFKESIQIPVNSIPKA